MGVRLIDSAARFIASKKNSQAAFASSTFRPPLSFNREIAKGLAGRDSLGVGILKGL